MSDAMEYTLEVTYLDELGERAYALIKGGIAGNTGFILDQRRVAVVSTSMARGGKWCLHTCYGSSLSLQA